MPSITTSIYESEWLWNSDGDKMCLAKNGDLAELDLSKEIILEVTASEPLEFLTVAIPTAGMSEMSAWPLSGKDNIVWTLTIDQMYYSEVPPIDVFSDIVFTGMDLAENDLKEMHFYEQGDCISYESLQGENVSLGEDDIHGFDLSVNANYNLDYQFEINEEQEIIVCLEFDETLILDNVFWWEFDSYNPSIDIGGVQVSVEPSPCFKLTPFVQDYRVTLYVINPDGTITSQTIKVTYFQYLSIVGPLAAEYLEPIGFHVAPGFNPALLPEVDGPYEYSWGLFIDDGNPNDGNDICKLPNNKPCYEHYGKTLILKDGLVEGNYIVTLRLKNPENDNFYSYNDGTLIEASPHYLSIDFDAEIEVNWNGGKAGLDIDDDFGFMFEQSWDWGGANCAYLHGDQLEAQEKVFESTHGLKEDGFNFSRGLMDIKIKDDIGTKSNFCAFDWDIPFNTAFTHTIGGAQIQNSNNSNIFLTPWQKTKKYKDFDADKYCFREENNLHILSRNLPDDNIVFAIRPNFYVQKWFSFALQNELESLNNQEGSIIINQDDWLNAYFVVYAPDGTVITSPTNIANLNWSANPCDCDEAEVYFSVDIFLNNLSNKNNQDGIYKVEIFTSCSNPYINTSETYTYRDELFIKFVDDGLVSDECEDFQALELSNNNDLYYSSNECGKIIIDPTEAITWYNNTGAISYFYEYGFLNKKRLSFNPHESTLVIDIEDFDWRSDIDPDNLVLGQPIFLTVCDDELDYCESFPIWPEYPQDNYFQISYQNVEDKIKHISLCLGETYAIMDDIILDNPQSYDLVWEFIPLNIEGGGSYFSQNPDPLGVFYGSGVGTFLYKIEARTETGYCNDEVLVKFVVDDFEIPTEPIVICQYETINLADYITGFCDIQVEPDEFKFQWFDGEGNGITENGNGYQLEDNNLYVSFEENGTYTFQVLLYDQNGQIYGSLKDINVIVNEIPIADAGEDMVICQNGSVVLEAQGGEAFLWSPTEGVTYYNTAKPLVTEGGIYTVTVTDLNGCTDTDEIAITFAEIDLEEEFAEDIYLKHLKFCYNETFALQDFIIASSELLEGTTLKWYKNGTEELAGENPIETVENFDTFYKLEIYGIKGCFDLPFTIIGHIQPAEDCLDCPLEAVDDKFIVIYDTYTNPCTALISWGYDNDYIKAFAYNVLINDIYEDCSDVVICSYTQPEFGTLEYLDGFFVYFPNEGLNFFHEILDNFTYTLCNNKGKQTTATVVVSIEDFNYEKNASIPKQMYFCFDNELEIPIKICAENFNVPYNSGLTPKDVYKINTAESVYFKDNAEITIFPEDVCVEYTPNQYGSDVLEVDYEYILEFSPGTDHPISIFGHVFEYTYYILSVPDCEDVTSCFETAPSEEERYYCSQGLTFYHYCYLIEHERQTYETEHCCPRNLSPCIGESISIGYDFGPNYNQYFYKWYKWADIGMQPEEYNIEDGELIGNTAILEYTSNGESDMLLKLVISDDNNDNTVATMTYQITSVENEIILPDIQNKFYFCKGEALSIGFNNLSEDYGYTWEDLTHNTIFLNNTPNISVQPFEDTKYRLTINNNTYEDYDWDILHYGDYTSCKEYIDIEVELIEEEKIIANEDDFEFELFYPFNTGNNPKKFELPILSNDEISNCEDQLVSLCTFTQPQFGQVIYESGKLYVYPDYDALVNMSPPSGVPNAPLINSIFHYELCLNGEFAAFAQVNVQFYSNLSDCNDDILLNTLPVFCIEPLENYEFYFDDYFDLPEWCQALSFDIVNVSTNYNADIEILENGIRYRSLPLFSGAETISVAIVFENGQEVTFEINIIVAEPENCDPYEGCPQQLNGGETVCGIDGISYLDPCYAEQNGIVYNEGPCDVETIYVCLGEEVTIGKETILESTYLWTPGGNTSAKLTFIPTENINYIQTILTTRWKCLWSRYI